MSDQLRSSQAATDDSRAVETRRRLTEAYVEAIGERPSTVSVVEICQRAGVGRSTFYTHFATIDDLAVAAVGDLFRDISPANVALRSAHDRPRAEVTRLGLEELLDSLWAGRDLLVFAIGLPGGPAIQQRIVAELAAATRPTVLVERPDATEVEMRFTTDYIAGGIVQLVLAWFDEPAVGRDDVVAHLLTLLPDWMTGPERA